MPVGEQYDIVSSLVQVKKAIPLKVLLHKLMPDNGGKIRIPRNIRDVSDNL
jgi:hypothetical protein